MWNRALRRLFLVLFPMALLGLALWMVHNRPDLKSEKSFSSNQSNSDFLNSNCPFYLGLSFFPLKDKKVSFNNKRGFIPPLWTESLLLKQDFLKILKNLKLDFKKTNVSLQKALFVFPLALTKEEQWIVSQKTFFIFPSGERKEVSHLTFAEIQKMIGKTKAQKSGTALRLKDVLTYLPNQNFLFYLNSSQTEKALKGLDNNFKDKTNGEIYLSSSNENLLKGILALDSDWKVLRSFKTLIKSQILSVFSPHFFTDFEGHGVLIPDFVSPSQDNLLLLKNQGRLLFFEKDPPYTLADYNLIGMAQALISSQPKQALSIAQKKKTCFMKSSTLK